MPDFTPDFLRTVLPREGEKQREWRDDIERGLIFRATEKGDRRWSVRYVNAAGEHRRKTIGPFPLIGLAKARAEARKIKGGIASRIDIVGAENASKGEAQRRRMNRLAALADAYFADACLGLHRANARAKRASTLTEERRIYEKHIRPKFGDWSVADISKREISDFVARETRRAPTTGRSCRDIIRQLMSYAVFKEVIDHNPALGVAVVNSQPRERVLSDSEVRAVWLAFADPDGGVTPAMGIALRMAMTTLQRGGEVAGMRWSEIDRKARTWRIPASRMKGKKTHLVPLSALALGLLDLAEEQVGGTEFVFESPRSAQAMDRRALTRAMSRTVKALGIPSASPHDFRRTGATNITSERIGIPRFIVSQVLAHAVNADVTGMHYDLNDYLVEKRRALDAWGKLLTEIASGEDRPANVTPIRKRG